jgi:hypothetical protein
LTSNKKFSMAADEYKDLRSKITRRAWCFLESESRATHKDISEIVRTILDTWAETRLQAHIEADKLLRSEGELGNETGASGRRRERSAEL